MDNARFLSILNRALGETGLDPTAPAARNDPAAVAAWAGFLRRCVAAGASIADPRWGQLEVRSEGLSHRLVLEADPHPPALEESEDFTLGLSLLMSMLGRGTGSGSS